MEFIHTEQRDLIIKATTAKEVAEMCKHYSLDITKYTNELVLGEMTRVSSGEKRPWFHQFAVVPFEFLKPYYDLLEKVTGYAGPAFTIGSPRLKYPGGYSTNLRLTHIVVDAAIDGEGYHAEGYIQAEDWNGQSAAMRAEINFDGYLRAALGDTKHEPQFIRLDNGLLKENPRYLRQHAPHPATTSVAVFELIFDHWFTHHASDAQRALWREGDETHRKVCRDSLAASMLRSYSQQFHVENYKRSVTFDEFKAAGQKESTQ